MGLAEKRAAQEFQTKSFPDWKTKIAAAAKFDVPVEVDWDSLAIADRAHLYNECWPDVFFKPLVDALEEITKDDLGREALKGKLKKVKIQNKADNSSASSWASFDNGLLTLDHQSCTNVFDVKGRADNARSVIEAAL